MTAMSYRSIRKLIRSELPHIAQLAEQLTQQSLNQQPEYFLSLKVAEAIYGHFKSCMFSMEMSLQDICKDVGLNIEEAPTECRIEGLRRADLVVKSAKTDRCRNVIEFKRGVKEGDLLSDARRLAWLCQNAEIGHRMEKNFLVTVTTSSKSVLDARSEVIENMLTDEFPVVSLKPEYVDLSQFKSTKSKSHGRGLQAMVWEFNCS